MSFTILIIYYIASVLSVLLYILSIQFKDKISILKVQVIASVFYALSYYLIKAFSGFGVEIIELVKNIVIINYEKSGKKVPRIFLIIIIIFLVIVSIITFNGFGGLIPLLINVLYVISSSSKDPKYIRFVILICGFLWIIYNIIVGAYIIIIGNVLEVISASISLIRFK